MAGYTPLFDSIATGTLCGKWPDLGLWAVVLSLADKNGIVDVTCDYIARITGIPEPEVEACMKRFREADPKSRSQECGGARLVLIANDRDWGWRIVNHGKYREKARKAAQQAESTESGRDAERKRAGRAAVIDKHWPAVSSGVQRYPAVSSDGRLSDADSDSNKEKKSEGKIALSPTRKLEIPDLTRHTPAQRARIAATKT